MELPKIPKCDIDDLTTKAIGEFGRWQFKVSFLMSIMKLPIAWYQLNIIFMAPPQEFWCVKPESFSKYSDEEWRKMSVPISQCALMWGVLIGGIMFGVIADQYGRRIPLMAAIAIQSITSFIASAMPHFWWWMAVRFILALASGGIGIISFVICVEVVSGKWRTTIPILYQLPFGLGSAVMALLAYWLRDWRKLEFALASISSLFLLYWFWIPESPRWLLATGQTQKAIEVLRIAAKQNKTEQNFQAMQNLLPKCNIVKLKGCGFMAFFKSKNMRTKTLLLSINWFFTGIAFFAFAQYLGTIAENIFLTVALSGIISLPGGLLCVCIIANNGRKRTLWVFKLATAICFIGIKMVPRYHFANDWPRLFFAGVGFAGLGGTVPALYLYSGELFPTVGRNAGVAGVTIFAKIAAMVAPAVVGLNVLVPDLPLIVLTITSLCQMLLIIPLPETKGYPLPDTLEQAEQFRREK